VLDIDGRRRVFKNEPIGLNNPYNFSCWLDETCQLLASLDQPLVRVTASSSQFHLRMTELLFIMRNRVSQDEVELGEKDDHFLGKDYVDKVIRVCGFHPLAQHDVIKFLKLHHDVIDVGKYVISRFCSSCRKRGGRGCHDDIITVDLSEASIFVRGLKELEANSSSSDPNVTLCSIYRRL